MKKMQMNIKKKNANDHYEKNANDHYEKNANEH